MKSKSTMTDGGESHQYIYTHKVDRGLGRWPLLTAKITPYQRKILRLGCSESRVPVGNQARRMTTMVGCLRHFRPARANLGAMGVCITLLAMIALSLRYSRYKNRDLERYRCTSVSHGYF